MCEIRVAHDFGAFQTARMPEPLRTVSLDTDFPIRVGQDGTGAYPHPLSCVLDELVLTRGMLTAEEIDALARHYGVR